MTTPVQSWHDWVPPGHCLVDVDLKTFDQHLEYVQMFKTAELHDVPYMKKIGKWVFGKFYVLDRPE